MSSTKEYVIWLKDCSSQYHLKVGGKNANLGQMLQIGLRVPPGLLSQRMPSIPFGRKRESGAKSFKSSLKSLRTMSKLSKRQAATCA
jgi:hypothetical protein